MRLLLPLAIALVVPFVMVYAASRVSRWRAGRLDKVDALIAQNSARPRAGMEQVDWQKTEKAGETRWQEALRAQRKARKKPRRAAAAKNVVPIRSRTA